MTRSSMSVGVIAAVLAGVLFGAAPAWAQVGSLYGKVVNEKGEPIAGAEILFTNTAAMMKVTGPKTNAKGEWSQAGLRVGQGTWSVEARKDGLSAGISDVMVRMNSQTQVPDLVLRTPPKASIGAASVDRGLDAGAAETRAKLITGVQKLYNDAVAAFNAKNYDAALSALNDAVAKMPDCGLCYLRLGEVYIAKKDLAAAEKAYLRLLAIDDKSQEAGEAYGGLTTIYNEQRRYEEARKAGEKAAALSGPAGAGDATSVFNMGVVLVNAGKFSEAKVQFERATKLDPKMADAHYWLGISYVSEGKLAEAKAAMVEYLKLAPMGQHAEAARELVK